MPLPTWLYCSTSQSAFGRDYYRYRLFLLRVAGFLLPCYIMAWAISILQRRRQRQPKKKKKKKTGRFINRPGSGPNRVLY
ncbi:putative E3 ubiquitin-protein ligase MARCH [Helianthus annuus]|nr:putative E3 ubiquitin-protein ligase MARCH [Helianthus annuus]